MALVDLVLPTHNVDADGHAGRRNPVIASPGDVRCSLIELLVDALDAPGRGPVVELVVAEGVVTATGGGELRL